MSSLYVHLPDGTQATYEESNLPALLRNGAVTLETPYWREGMTDWRPLREHPVFAQVPATSPYPWTKNLEPFAIITLVFLGLYGLSCFGYILTGILMVVHISGSDGSTTQIDLGLLGISILGNLGLVLVTSIPFAIWTYRAARNAIAWSGGLTYSAGFTVGSYFIPLACLFIPCLAMQEIWKASRNPSDFLKSERNSYLIGFWWATWLITGFYGQIFFRLIGDLNAPDLHWTTTTIPVAFIILGLLKIILTILAGTMVYFITANQKKLATSGAIFP